MITEWPNGHSMLSAHSTFFQYSPLFLPVCPAQIFGADIVLIGIEMQAIYSFIWFRTVVERLKCVRFTFGFYLKNDASIEIGCVNAKQQSTSVDNATMNESSTTNNITIHPDRIIWRWRYSFSIAVLFIGALGENSCAVQNGKRNNNSKKQTLFACFID